MTLLEQIKGKTNIDVESMLIERLCVELSLPKGVVNNKSNKTDIGYLEEAVQQLEYDILDVLMIILDHTNLRKVPKEMYATVVNMVKDYWSLNHHDRLFLTEEEKKSREELQVKSISIGDTTTTFSDKQSQITINGVSYNTGTVDFAKNILQEKYKEDFYRHRRMAWD